MIRLSATGPTVPGLDTSHYDATINFGDVAKAGYKFCWGKCTEGSASSDIFYLSNKRKAKDAGLLYGAYHFYRPYQNPLAQAEWFLKSAFISAGDLRPMFDWEILSNKVLDVDNAKIFLNKVEAEVGVKPFIYGGPYFLDAYNLPKLFADYPLVIAHYGTLQPLVPRPWKAWTFHQFTDKGSIQGVPLAGVDHDRFNGTLEDLKKFVI